MYTDVELAALDAADEAFAEVMKVAERFAKEINCDYRRVSNSWTSYSSFDVPLFDSRKTSWKPIEHFASEFDGDAYECAVQLVEAWNETISTLGKARDAYYAAIDDPEAWYEGNHWIREIDLLYNDRDYLLNELGKIVETWYDSACDCAYEAYLEEHAA